MREAVMQARRNCGYLAQEVASVLSAGRSANWRSILRCMSHQGMRTVGFNVRDFHVYR